jgi:hypothetical protein
MVPPFLNISTPLAIHDCVSQAFLHPGDRLPSPRRRLAFRVPHWPGSISCWSTSACRDIALSRASVCVASTRTPVPSKRAELLTCLASCTIRTSESSDRPVQMDYRRGFETLGPAPLQLTERCRLPKGMANSSSLINRIRAKSRGHDHPCALSSQVYQTETAFGAGRNNPRGLKWG